MDLRSDSVSPQRIFSKLRYDSTVRDLSLHFPDPVHSLNAALWNRQSSPAYVSPCTSSMSPTPTPSPRIPCAPPKPVPCAAQAPSSLNGLINQQTLSSGTPEMFVETPGEAVWGPCGLTGGRQQNLGEMAQQSGKFLLQSQS